MKEFKLSDKVDKNKVFLIQSSKIEKRLDCDYYLPKHFKLLERLKSSKHSLLKFKNISKRIVDGPFGSSVKADDYVTDGIPFIRVADVTRGQGTIDTKDLIYISEEKHKEIIRSIIHPGDVVIAKTGATMGVASLVPETIKEGNIRGDLAAVSFEGDLELAQYITNYINTDIGYKLFWRINSGSTRGRVVISNLKEYPVILPDRETIIAINKIIKNGRANKLDKLSQAQILLDSIDDYLLKELGITLPEQDNRLENRMFTTEFSKVSGGRFDPDYTSKIDFIDNLETKYPKEKLKDLLLASPQYGANEGATIPISDDDTRYIRITDIDDYGILKAKSWKTASKKRVDNERCLKFFLN